MKIYSFPPISDQHSKVLVLGTMPGVMSLKLNQYYGHGGNAFWKFIFSIFELPFSNNYEKKKSILLEHNIALWDVLKACEREGSADNAIVQEEPNDFKSFFDGHPNIKLIAFNGQNSAAYFNSQSNCKPDVGYITLPSTSKANTWKTVEEKLSKWEIIKSI